MRQTVKYGWLLAIFASMGNLACLVVPKEERDNLPPRVEAKLCPDDKITNQISEESDSKTPTRRLSLGEFPLFKDDLDFKDLDLVIDRQLKRFAERDMKGFVWFGEDRYHRRAVKASLSHLKSYTRRARLCVITGGPNRREECMSDFNQRIREKFAVYIPELKPGDPRYGEDRPILVTGYYTPHLEVSEVQDEVFRYPIYQKPIDEWVKRMGRYQIDFRSGLAGYGLELYYAKSLFDVYLLHLEGGGRVSFRDRKNRTSSSYVSYGGSNSRQWRFISALMVDRNWISETAVPYQREFIDENPSLLPEIFSFCPSYVFFKKTTHPPEGSDVVPLTDNRSIATDVNHYRFKGVPAFVISERPRTLEKNVEMIPFSRFVIDQDTGGAIRGKGRVDFYFGEGDYAELAANSLKQRGDLFYLMLKAEANVP